MLAVVVGGHGCERMLSCRLTSLSTHPWGNFPIVIINGCTYPINTCFRNVFQSRLTVGSSVEVRLSGQDDLELMTLLSGPRKVRVCNKLGKDHM